MSRIGKHEVEVPEGVNLSIDGNVINVKAVSYTHLRAHET